MKSGNPGHSLDRLLEQSEIPRDSEPARRLAGYLELLEKWNARINLTASTEWGAIEPLIAEAIWATRFYPAGADSHLDIGSGAGFPAIVLKILIPRIALDLVESRRKKTEFLQTAAQILGIGGVRAHHARLDEFLLRRGGNASWDCVSWKGLKLSRADLELLRARVSEGAQFWIFHGKEMALEDPDRAVEGLELIRSERFPGRKDWNLTIYEKSENVSRETRRKKLGPCFT